MTASMPLPREPEEEDAIAARDGAAARPPGGVTQLPTRPSLAGDDAASSAEAPDDDEAPPKASPRGASSKGRTTATKASNTGARKTPVKKRPRAADSAPRAAAKTPRKGTGTSKPPPVPRVPAAEAAEESAVAASIAAAGPPPPVPAGIVEADGETILVPPKPPLPPEPEVVEAEAVEPEVVEPEVVEAEAVEAETVDSEVVEPEVVEPEVVEPEDAVIEAAVGHPADATEPEASVPALSLRGVTKTFGATRAVDGIDLTVPRGTFYGIVGPNGAGKTTTLSMIAGLLRPTKGTIAVNGVDAAAKPLAAKRAMGVLPDRLRTFDRLTGRQLLHYYGVLRGLPPAVVESRTADLARAFDLTDALGRVVSDYSAGMTKKVMLAGAMIHSPRLLVLDEPFEAVDPVSSAIILDILSAYVANGGTVVLSSHGMELVERVCTRVAVIVAGQVLAEGTLDEVRGELTLEQRFIELAGGLSDVEGLEWLHTFSD